MLSSSSSTKNFRLFGRICGWFGCSGAFDLLGRGPEGFIALVPIPEGGWVADARQRGLFRPWGGSLRRHGGVFRSDGWGHMMGQQEGIARSPGRMRFC